MILRSFLNYNTNAWQDQNLKKLFTEVYKNGYRNCVSAVTRKGGEGAAKNKNKIGREVANDENRIG